MEDKLKESVFFVEANSFESLKLWIDGKASKIAWVQDNMGFYLTVGDLSKDMSMPVVVSFSFAIIQGHRVCFFYSSGRYSDSVMIEEWLDRNYPKHWDNGTRTARCDAMNFHHCLNHIEKLNAYRQPE